MKPEECTDKEILSANKSARAKSWGRCRTGCKHSALLDPVAELGGCYRYDRMGNAKWLTQVRKGRATAVREYKGNYCRITWFHGFIVCLILSPTLMTA